MKHRRTPARSGSAFKRGVSVAAAAAVVTAASFGIHTMVATAGPLADIPVIGPILDPILFPSASPSASPSGSPSASPGSPAPTITLTPSISPSATATPSPSVSASPSSSASPTETPSPTPTQTGEPIAPQPVLRQAHTASTATFSVSTEPRYAGKAVYFFRKSGQTGKVQPLGATAVLESGLAIRSLNGLKPGQIIRAYAKVMDVDNIVTPYSNDVAFKTG